MAHEKLHARARERGVNPFVYWLVRAILQPAFHIYFRLSRIGREHISEAGPVIIAANHRSFLDPFVIGLLVRRPIYYLSKQELFRNRFAAWLLNSLGAFPVDRGNGDEASMETARAILERGDCVLIFPEGTRTRPGSLGRPRCGVGRLALETGAPVIPVAVFGTEAVRRGWRIRPHKVRIRCGSALRFPRVEAPSRQLAGAVTDRIWPCVMLQWEWLGGLAPLRRAAVLGATEPGLAVASMLARAGLEVELGARSHEQAATLGDALAPGMRAMRTADLELGGHDLVVFADQAHALPAAVAAHGGAIPQRAGVLVLARGLIPPLGAHPTEYVAERVRARAVACLAGPQLSPAALEHGAAPLVACRDAPFARQLVDALQAAGYDARDSRDVAGAELAACAVDAAGLAVALAAAAGPTVAGVAAGKVFDELDAYAALRGGSQALAGLAGAGGLVATVLRAGPGGSNTGSSDGAESEARDAVSLLAATLRDAGVRAPTVDGLAATVEGRIEPERFTAALTEPSRRPDSMRAA